MMDLFLPIGVGVILLLLGILVFRRSNSGAEETAKIFTEFEKDRELRYRETESLRKELRETTRSLQEQFFQVNKTVDTKLSESGKQLNERLDKSSAIIGSLQKELGKMGEIGSKIENLDKILRAPKGRGSMGEESLEEILRSVFPPNLWSRQYALGHGLIVDTAIHTDGGIIPVDAKFPLPAFERIMQSETEEARVAAQKEFSKDMKKRIDEVSKYIRRESGTLDFAILFLPNENVYYEAAIRVGEISDYARTKKVLLVGPNTLLYVLQVLFQAYQSQQFAHKAQEALAQLSGVKKQAERVDDAIETLGKHLGNATARLGDVQTENRKLQTQIDRVVTLESGVDEEQKKLL